MNNLFEKGDPLNRPVECFYYSADENDFPVRPHWHYYMELTYMLEGSALINVGGSSFELHSGEMLLIHPKSVHSVYGIGSSAPRYAVFKLDISRLNITSSYSPKLRSIFRYAEKKGARITFSSGDTARMGAEGIFRRCISEMNAQEYGYDLVTRSCIYDLLINIIRCWQLDGFVIDNDAFFEDTHYDIFNVTEYIDSNLGSGLKVADIAEACGMSYSYFAKQFLSVYGKTCKEYIEEMRIYKAEEFLIFTDFDLTYISQETGFSDCSHMIKSFKKLMGITPKQYRMKRRRDDDAHQNAAE